MKLADNHALVTKYNEQNALEQDRELPVMSAATWLHGFEYWDSHHEKELASEELDWSSA